MRSTVNQVNLHWRAAHQAALAATAQAEQLGIRIHVAVVDRAGLTLAYLRMSDAYLHSADIASDKAYTAASFGFPSSAWLGILEANPAMRLGFPQRERLIVFGGGLPIRDAAGELVGGIGVSGGTEAEDEACALAGLAGIGLKPDGD
ncbi:MAG: cobalamin adenosyltransferase [Gammaproteobacteria bacterium HGW-Gammaproteobacteria-11]|nr:MAG: cobalamin adenosyltransferase [Gammaproteobacteria bacterium HGW-Gammaproteobacteria-11]